VRLFVGITPTAETLAHAAGALPALATDLRWVPEERWHVTLAFLGEVDPDRVPALAVRLDAVAADHAPLEGLRLAGAGTFRGVLWLGIEPTERHSPADRLARGVQREMRAAGISVERRPWRAHLTIARWRPSAARDAVAHRMVDSLAGYASPAFDVHQIRLVHSITGPDPSHTDIHIARLTSDRQLAAGMQEAET
jgi:RNA 2',3'-cyclic 3'-phosphodiesterase